MTIPDVGCKAVSVEVLLVVTFAPASSFDFFLSSAVAGQGDRTHVHDVAQPGRLHTKQAIVVQVKQI